MTLFALPLLVWSLPQAALSAQAPDFRVSIEDSRVVAIPEAGTHINTRAPMQLITPGSPNPQKPARASKDRVEFALAAPAAREARVELYLCDDANTFCEKHAVALNSLDKTPQVGFVKGSRAFSPKNLVPGFHHDPAKALAEAKKSSRPILLFFHAIWCPPCNLYKQTLFPTSAFKKSVSRFVKLAIDADTEESWELKSKYKVGGYPTIVFLDSQGEEIRRIVGFREFAEFKKEADQALNERAVPYSKLAGCAENGDRNCMDRLGILELERRNLERAAALLKDTARFRPRLFEARIALLEEVMKSGDLSVRARLLEVLKDASESLSRMPDSVVYLEKLAELVGDTDRDAAARYANASKERMRTFVEHPDLLRGTDYSLGDLWASVAGAYEASANRAESENAWKAAANAHQALIRAKTGEKELDRGSHLELAYCLWKSGDIPHAEAIYQRLQAAFPSEATFYYQNAQMWLQNKHPDRALPLARKAFERSYGDNKLTSALALAKALKGTNRKAEALAIVESVIQSTSLPQDGDIRTHRYIRRLKEFAKDQ